MFVCVFVLKTKSPYLSFPADNLIFTLTVSALQNADPSSPGVVLDVDALFTAEGPTDSASEYHLQVRETKLF